MSNKLVTCPYDEAHRMKESRLAVHITKCRINHLGDEKFTCSFNASHIVPIQEKDYHLERCPDKAFIDRALVFKALEKNNPFKGNTAVPSYTASAPTNDPCEVWDEGVDLMQPAPGFVPAETPTCAIVEPPALSQPAERRRLYQELHRRPEQEIDDSRTLEDKPKLPRSRQPKSQSEVEQKAASECEPLGLGRGRPIAAAAPSRIAANIFTPNPAPQNVTTNGNINYSAALSGMSNLGLGRGSPALAVSGDLLDDDFPVLGCGRGVYRTTKSEVRYPGVKN